MSTIKPVKYPFPFTHLKLWIMSSNVTLISGLVSFFEKTDKSDIASARSLFKKASDEILTQMAVAMLINNDLPSHDHVLSNPERIVVFIRRDTKRKFGMKALRSRLATKKAQNAHILIIISSADFTPEITAYAGDAGKPIHLLSEDIFIAMYLEQKARHRSRSGLRYSKST